MWGLCALLAASLAIGCSPRDSYRCASSDQCVGNGGNGVCEPTGFCSFADPACSGGRRYDISAGGGLAGTCASVDAAVPDAAPCGAVGEACCMGESASACVATAFCNSGTCSTCVTDVGLSRHHSCVLRHDQTVWCVGENDHGQIGSGIAGANITTWSQVREVSGPALTGVTAMGTGGQFTCVVRAGGTVWCWGENNAGQLGINSTVDSLTAAQVRQANNMPLTGIVEVRGGNNHACAIDGGSAVWCWGRNDFGQVGDGTVTQRTGAVQVLVAPAGAPFVGAVELTMGNQHACVRKASNEVWCWGRNTQGALGDGSTTNRVNPVIVGSGKSVAAGSRHTCRVHLDGTASCTGATYRGRLGNATANQDDLSPLFVATPVQVLAARNGPALQDIAEIVAGGLSCAVMLDGTVRCWGDNMHGQIGAGVGSPVPVGVVTADMQPLRGVDRLIARFAHACVRRVDGAWWCWGRNVDSELGDGTQIDHGFPTPLAFTCP